MATVRDKTLVIVESPAKAKTIRQFLGDDYVVEASFGHVRDLPTNATEIPEEVKKQKWSRLGVNVDAGFEPLYIIPAEKRKHVSKLKAALKDAGTILLATDEDREGESISWHLLQVLSPPKNVQVSRIVFHEITKEAIRAAILKPRQLDEALVRAQESRRIIDRLYGYTLSPLLWKKVAPGLSAGRVQSVATRLIVERERQRKAFVTADYWDLLADLKHSNGRFRTTLVKVGDSRLATGKSFDSNTGELKEKRHLLLDEQGAKKLQQVAETSRPWRVSKLEQTPGQERPVPPFTTSTMQQEANRKLRYSSKKTMQIAQVLYEGIDLQGERVGLITYMRTDSLTLSEKAVSEAREVIRDLYGADYLPPSAIRYKTTTKNAQEAHEAIRPSDLSRRPQDVRKYLDEDQYRLYEMIWKRTIACQMVPARVLRTNVEVEVRDQIYTASGKQILFPGFLRAYVEGSDDPEAEIGDKENLLPLMKEGDTLEPLSVQAQGHSTRPPARYTEASLVKKLEEEGIGRPSTYATIISTIQDRGYIFKRANELVPTFTAFCVTEFLETHFHDLVDVGFTSIMEDQLDEIATGKRESIAQLRSFYYGANEEPGLVKRVENEQQKLEFPRIKMGDDTNGGGPIVVKLGKFGPYLQRGEGGNGNFAPVPEDLPPADLTLEMAVEMLNQKSAGPQVLGQDLATGQPITLQKGRFGEYLEVVLSEAQVAAGEKPRRVSIPAGLTAADVTVEIAQQLISLPRVLGKHPESREEISTGLGRFGPYVKCGSDFRSLPTWQVACSMPLEEALEILSKPKQLKGRAAAPSAPLKEFGALEGAAGPVRVLAGRYGPYVTDGKTNASLPKGKSPEDFTAAEAIELLAQRAAATGGKPARGAKRKPGAKTAKAEVAPAKAGKKAGAKAVAAPDGATAEAPKKATAKGAGKAATAADGESAVPAKAAGKAVGKSASGKTAASKTAAKKAPGKSGGLAAKQKPGGMAAKQKPAGMAAKNLAAKKAAAAPEPPPEPVKTEPGAPKILLLKKKAG